MRETKARRKAVISKKSDPSKLSGLVSKRKSQINLLDRKSQAGSLKKNSGLSRSRIMLPKMSKDKKLKKNSKTSKSMVFSRRGESRKLKLKLQLI